jgi:hypothetical protein
MLSNDTMPVLPKNLRKWFINYDQLSIANVGEFPNFRRDMFGEFTHLKHLYTYNLPMVNNIPRDAFWDMTMLTYLYFNGMPNLVNMDSDLLIKMPSLEFFSARGPNQITQINPGFFRNQMGSLKTVDFRDTNLMRISFNVFENFRVLRDARFVNAGCLNLMYVNNVASKLTADIHAHCADVTSDNDNEIRKNQRSSSTSSSESD